MNESTVHFIHKTTYEMKIRFRVEWSQHHDGDRIRLNDSNNST